MTVAVETGTWQLDPAASTVALRHKTFWGLVTVKGAFAAVTGNAKRDEHLRAADFFDTANHPEITFSVRSAELRADDTVHVVGQLTVRGISRPKSFTARLVGADADALTLDTEFTVDRDQFGMGWNQLGMIRGLTTVAGTLRFTRTAAA